MPLYQYSANNAGGRWHLTKEDWRSLEANGWTVLWRRTDYARRPYGEREFATKAYIEAPSEGIAIALWEHATGEKRGNGYCPCCGFAHNFYSTTQKEMDEYAKWYAEEDRKAGHG